MGPYAGAAKQQAAAGLEARLAAAQRPPASPAQFVQQQPWGLLAQPQPGLLPDAVVAQMTTAAQVQGVVISKHADVLERPTKEFKCGACGQRKERGHSLTCENAQPPASAGPSRR